MEVEDKQYRRLGTGLIFFALTEQRLTKRKQQRVNRRVPRDTLFWQEVSNTDTCTPYSLGKSHFQAVSILINVRL